MFEIEEDDYYDGDYLYGFPSKLETLIINGGEMDSSFGWDVIAKNHKTLKTIDMSAMTNISLLAEALKNCYQLETLTLPSQLEEVSYMSIAECVSLKSIAIPATVTEISNRAFENCRMLSSVEFANNGALTHIGNWAFYNCHELIELAIPEGVTELVMLPFMVVHISQN